MGYNSEGYFTWRGILGYNAKYSFVLSDRGRGKTWDAHWFLLNQEGKFMFLTRTDPDLKSAMADWLDQFYEGDKDHDPLPPELFEWKGSDEEGWQLYYCGELKGYFRTISAVNHIKQEKFPDDLNWVYVEEFIPLVYKKLAGVESEGDAIRAIVKTIEHDTIHDRKEKGLKPVRVMLCANPFTWNNTILAYFKIVPRLDDEDNPIYGVWRIAPDIVCELLEPYEKPKKDNKMTVDEFLGDEVNRNQGWSNQLDFVCPRPKGSHVWYSARFKDRYFWIWKGQGKKLWVQEARGHYPNASMMGTLDGLKEREKCWDRTTTADLIRRRAYNGSILYSDLNTKFGFLEALNTKK